MLSSKIDYWKLNKQLVIHRSVKRGGHATSDMFRARVGSETCPFLTALRDFLLITGSSSVPSFTVTEFTNRVSATAAERYHVLTAGKLTLA